MTDTPTPAQAEVERIKEDYRRRDAAASSGQGYAGAGYHFYMQQLEWTLLHELRRAQVPFVGTDVLEVGCGGGYFLNRFLDFGARSASGIDLMAGRIEEAQRRYPRLDVRVGNAAELPWADGSFDLVTQFTCLCSVLDPGLRQAILAEMWRVLRPGGAFVSLDLRGMLAPLRVAGRLQRRWRRSRLGAAAPPDTAVSPVTLGELRAAFPQAVEVRHRSFGIPLELAAVAGHSRLAGAALSALPPLRTHLLVVVRRGAS